MPRIRTVKPEFWTDGDIVELSAFARLLFIGSWNFAMCDRGHVADDVKRLKMQVLPADSVDAGDLLKEILDHGRMDRLTLPDGRTVLHIRRFTDHQRIEKRWNSRCFACEQLGLQNLAEPRPNSREVSRDTQSLAQTHTNSAQEGKGREGRGRETKDSPSETASAVPDEKRREDVERICQHLAERMVDNGCKRPRVTKAWRADARRMLEIDGHTEDQIHRAIDWCQSDPFWRSNVLSIPTLREKYDQLRLAALRPPPAPSGGPADFSAAMARAQARDAQKGLTA